MLGTTKLATVIGVVMIESAYPSRNEQKLGYNVPLSEPFQSRRLLEGVMLSSRGLRTPEMIPATAGDRHV